MESQVLYLNSFHYPKHYDPTVHEAIRRPLNFHVINENQIPTPKPIRYGYQPIPLKGSNSIEVYPQNSKNDYPSENQPEYGRRYTFKIKDSDKASKQGGNLDKANQFRYIDIAVSCKYNITKCSSYTSRYGLRDGNTNTFASTQKKNTLSKSYKNDYLLRQDFMPIFEYDSDKISGKSYHIKSQDSAFRMNFDYDPTETLFRHSFDKYEPNVHKYITSNMRNIN